MKKLLLALAALAFATPAMAQGPTLPQAGEVTDFSMDSLLGLVHDAGWKARPFEEDNGLRGIGVTIGSRELVLVPTACNDAGSCKGLYTYALIPDNPGAVDLNRFNLAYNPARATSQGGALVLDNYLIGDYGVVRGTLAVHLLVQADLIGAWWKFRQGDTQIDLSKSVAFAPLVPAPGFPGRVLRPDARPLELPLADRKRMLEANAGRFN